MMTIKTLDQLFHVLSIQEAIPHWTDLQSSCQESRKHSKQHTFSTVFHL